MSNVIEAIPVEIETESFDTSYFGHDSRMSYIEAGHNAIYTHDLFMKLKSRIVDIERACGLYPNRDAWAGHCYNVDYVAKQIEDAEALIRRDFENTRPQITDVSVRVISNHLLDVLKEAKKLRPTKKRLKELFGGMADEQYETVFDTLTLHADREYRLHIIQTVINQDGQAEAVYHGFLNHRSDFYGEFQVTVPLDLMHKIVTLSEREARLHLSFSAKAGTLALSQAGRDHGKGYPAWKSTLKIITDNQ